MNEQMNEQIRVQEIFAAPTFATRGELAQALNNASAIVSEAYTHFDKAAEYENKVKNQWKLDVAAFFVLCIPWIGTVAGIASYVFLYKRRAALKASAAEETEHGNAVLNNNGEYLGFIPSKYYFPAAIQYMLESVQSGRADTLKEAMQQTETQLHNWNMENMQVQIVAETRNAASAARSASFWSFMGWLGRL